MQLAAECGIDLVAMAVGPARFGSADVVGFLEHTLALTDFVQQHGLYLQDAVVAARHRALFDTDLARRLPQNASGATRSQLEVCCRLCHTAIFSQHSWTTADDQTAAAAQALHDASVAAGSGSGEYGYLDTNTQEQPAPLAASCASVGGRQAGDETLELAEVPAEVVPAGTRESAVDGGKTPFTMNGNRYLSANFACFTSECMLRYLHV